MYCKNCGKLLSADAKFCSECGTKVEVEAPKPKTPEPVFFTEKREEAPAKPKKVVHLDEFNWDLEGYPTAPKKTEDVDFNWASVLEEKARASAPRVMPKKEETEEPTVTVEELVDALPEEDAANQNCTLDEEAAESLEAEIFDQLEQDVIEEPTKLIDKAQMKAEGVDKFYTFNQKQAELQAILDQEYARIQSGEEEPFEAEAEPQPLPEFLQPEEPKVEAEETTSVEEIVQLAETLQVEPVSAEPELVAVVWAAAPAGIVVEPKMAETAEELPEVEPAKAEAEDCPSKSEDHPAEEKAEPQPEEHKLTFDDIFRDDDEDDEAEKEKGGCLKVIAILLCILVVIELAILGVQYFAPSSQAGKYIDQAYNYVMTLIQGNGDIDDQEEVSGPSEVQQIITKQMAKNENIVSVVENNQLFFEEGEGYGYDEFADTYAFKNSPWYDGEEGESVSFGDEIIGTLIQYYSALADRMNDVNKDVYDFIDETSAFYEEVESLEGADDLEYVINNLEIGEIRTGASGFYVLTRVNTVDRQHTEGETEMQVVYLEPNTSKNEMKVIEIQKI